MELVTHEKSSTPVGDTVFVGACRVLPLVDLTEMAGTQDGLSWGREVHRLIDASLKRQVTLTWLAWEDGCWPKRAVTWKYTSGRQTS